MKTGGADDDVDARHASSTGACLFSRTFLFTATTCSPSGGNGGATASAAMSNPCTPIPMPPQTTRPSRRSFSRNYETVAR